MITRKLLSPSDLTKAQVLHIYELTEVVMACKNKDLIFAAFKIVTPSLEGFNDS